MRGHVSIHNTCVRLVHVCLTCWSMFWFAMHKIFRSRCTKWYAWTSCSQRAHLSTQQHWRVPTSIGYRSPVLSLDCNLWRIRRMLWLQLHGFSACALFWLLWTSASTSTKVWRCISEAHLTSQRKTVLRSMSTKYSDIKPEMCVTLWTCGWWECAFVHV